ncbi:MAG: hypothetical protein JOZ50_02385 [Candidatus Eremiobacteraeota bacterium]|nr:hypothetical protein [Candidatus Eremiobacteraeota bacterium]
MVKAHVNPLIVAVVSTAAVVLMGASSAPPPAVPQIAMPKGSAMIYNAGNADFTGYRIVVSTTGQAWAIDGAGRSSNQLESTVTQKLFNDLAAAGPLDKLPAGDCASKAAADATTVEVNASVIITWNSQHTPALTCVTEPNAVKLLLDATTIQHALYVQAYRERVTVAYGSTVVYGPNGVSYARGSYAGGFAYGGGSDYYDGRFMFQPFKNEGFGYDQFSGGHLSFDHFDNEYPQAGGVFLTNIPGGTNPFVNIPYSSPYNGSPWSSLPQVYPFQGSMPTTNIETTSPFSSLPGSSPFVSPNLHSLP